MTNIKLYDYQTETIKRLKPGNILMGKVGSGKTFTALFYYYYNFSLKDLVVITTAKKRDTKDWENEAAEVGISVITVDSWNNIKKYESCVNKFFIFDEQRLCGKGAWTKSFQKIAKNNTWILLSATPGDVWLDYAQVFIANGFYKNITDFKNQHVVYDPFCTKYPRIKKYIGESKLQALRRQIVIPMDGYRKTIRHRFYNKTPYDEKVYDMALKNYFDIYEGKPAETKARMTQIARRIVAESPARISKAKELMSLNDKVIIFYNYNYELDILIELCEQVGKPYAQWNGHKHESIPDTEQWLYLCHYAAAEGWNCTDTDTVMFYSPNYSYKVMEQAEGRIDRVNTKFIDLNYHYLVSNSSIDKSVMTALHRKGVFNEAAWEPLAKMKISSNQKTHHISRTKTTM